MGLPTFHGDVLFLKGANGSTLASSIGDDAGGDLPVNAFADDTAHRAVGERVVAKLATRSSLAIFAVVVFAAVAVLIRRAARARLAKRDEPSDAEAAIARGNAAYLDALKRGDAPAYASLFTDDAVSMPASGTMLRGRDAIEASIEHAFTRVRFRDGSLDTTGTRVEGSTAYESGNYAFDVESDGVPATLSGQYLVVWRKAGDEWKIALDSSQPGVPA